MRSAKQSLRRKLITEAKLLANRNPLYLAQQSQLIADHLHQFIHASLVQRDADDLTSAAFTLPAVPAAAYHGGFSTVYVCAYWALFYEVDLASLFKRLWGEADQPHSVNVVILLPVVLTSSIVSRIQQQYGGTHDSTSSEAPAMLFVEVRGQEDLENYFEYASTGPKLLEMKPEVLIDLLSPVPSLPPRQVVLCDEWEKMFPGCGTEPPHCVVPSACTEALLLVLTPGIGFTQSTGLRLGKGGGFYDRFLSFYAPFRVRDDGMRAGGLTSLTVGIALDGQVVASIPVEPLDMPVMGLVTPKLGVTWCQNFDLVRLD